MKCTVLLASAALSWGAVAAQTTIDPSKGTADPCRADVSRFEQTIGFVRQNQGQQAATDLKEKLLPAKMESDLLFREGYCGLAKYLRDKKLVR